MATFTQQPQDVSGVSDSMTYLGSIKVNYDGADKNTKLSIRNGGTESDLDLTQGVSWDSDGAQTTVTFKDPGIPANFPAGSCTLEFYLENSPSATSNAFTLKYLF